MAPEPETFTKADLDRIRKEERAKAEAETERLKGQFDEAATKLEELTQVEAKRVASAEKAAKAEAEAAAKAAKDEAEEELSAKELLAKRDAEHAAELADLERKFEQRFAVNEMERKFLSLKAYVQSKITEAKSEIAPEFYDYITGENEAEIDASIALAKQKTQAIKDAFKGARRGGAPQGVSTAAGPTSMGSVIEGQEELDPTKMSYAEFVKNREKLVPNRGQSGLFS